MCRRKKNAPSTYIPTQTAAPRKSARNLGEYYDYKKIQEILRDPNTVVLPPILHPMIMPFGALPSLGRNEDDEDFDDM